MNLSCDNLAIWSLIITVFGLIASVFGAVMAWWAEKAAKGAKEAVEIVRLKLEKKRDVEGLEIILKKARCIQRIPGKYLPEEKSGLEDSDIEKDADLLDKFISELNNRKNSVEKETKINVAEICRILTKSLEAFKGKDYKKINKAAKQISPIINDLIPKIKKVIEDNELNVMALG